MSVDKLGPNINSSRTTLRFKWFGAVAQLGER